MGFAGSISTMTTIAIVTFLGIELAERTVALLGVGAIAILLGLSAFFSSSETAMFSLARHRVDALLEEKRRGANTVRSLMDDPHRLLVTILVGNTAANVAMASIATGLLALYVSGGAAVAIATFAITALVLLFGETAPKSYAVEYTEEWSLKVAQPLQLFAYVLYPPVLVFDVLARQINRLTGSSGMIEAPYVTRTEIQEMLETGEKEGVIDEEEHEMLQRIFRFTNTIAKEVMTPRLDVVAVKREASIEEAIETCVQSGHEMVPVYDGNLDNVLGIVTLRELIRELHYGEGAELELSDLVSPTLHVPESKSADELLSEMREERLEMVIVIDEFGTTEGLITVEDMVEEIVGEILQGGEEHPVEFVDDNTVVVRGEVNIDEVNEALEIELPEGEEFETIAGFVFNRAGRLVEEGETFVYDGVEITVELVENTRIMKARVHREATPVAESEVEEVQ